MNEKIFQEVYDIVDEVIPVGWQKRVFYAGYTQGSYSMKYFIDLGNDEYIDCFSLQNVTSSQLLKLFMKIDKVLSKERDRLIGENKWNVLTLIVDSNGEFKAEFDYSDISKEFVSYEERWQKKYLE